MIDSKTSRLLHKPVNVNPPAVKLPVVRVMRTDYSHRLLVSTDLRVDVQRGAVITTEGKCVYTEQRCNL